VKFYFENDSGVKFARQGVEKGHESVEERWYELETRIAKLEKVEWAGLAAVGAVKSRVWEKDETRETTRYYLTTLTDAERFAEAVRGHWSVENQLHWCLDVTFDEDTSKVRKGNAPLVWNAMRKAAVTLFKQTDLDKKMNVKHKMFMAAMDENTLELILFRKSK